MPIGVIEVVNATKDVLQYYNEESGYSFVLQPNSKKYNDKGCLSASSLHDDTVPFRSSGRKINVIVQNGGPHFSVCDDNWHFYVFGMPKPAQWTPSYSNGDKFVMKVESDFVTFVKYDESTLNAGDSGYIVITGNPGAADEIKNSPYKIKLR